MVPFRRNERAKVSLGGEASFKREMGISRSYPEPKNQIAEKGGNRTYVRVIRTGGICWNQGQPAERKRSTRKGHAKNQLSRMIGGKKQTTFELRGVKDTGGKEDFKGNQAVEC